MDPQDANTFYIATYGCTYNSADSDKMKRVLIDVGYSQQDIQKAKILILNTCAVKLPTEQKIIETIKKYSSIIQKKAIDIEQYHNMISDEETEGLEDTQIQEINAEILIIAGCLPFISNSTLEIIKKIIPERGGILSPKSITRIHELIKRIQNGEKKVIISQETLKEKEIIPPYITQGQSGAAIQIAEGCSGNCAYCCTKNARGKLCSFSPESIISTIQTLNKEGIKEFYITAQDLGAYHYQDEKLHDLLAKILSIQSNFKLRLGMMNPEYLKTHIDKIIELLKDKRIYRFIHIPVQSGSDNILKIMRRKYTIKDFNDIVQKLQKFDPNISISTDIICGFPGENEQDWSQTIELIKNLKPAVLNISKYTVRPDTEAKKMVQLPSKEIKKRSIELTALYDMIAQEIGKQRIGTVEEVFVSEKNPDIPDNFTARNIYYHSIVIKNVELGKRYKVKITDYKFHYYFAEVITELRD